jgi:hypothetical protein
LRSARGYCIKRLAGRTGGFRSCVVDAFQCALYFSSTGFRPFRIYGDA